MIRNSIRNALSTVTLMLPLAMIAGCGAQAGSDGNAQGDSPDNAKLKQSLITEGMSDALKNSILTAPVFDAVAVPEGQEYKGVVPAFHVLTYCDANAGANALAIAIGNGHTGTVVGVYSLPAIPKCSNSSQTYTIAGGNLDGYVDAMIVGVNQGQDIHLNWVSTWSVLNGTAQSKICNFNKWVDGTTGAFTWCN